MNKNEKVEYWTAIATYDLDTAIAMFQSKRWLYVGFMCHQVIEKMLKAYYCSFKDDVPPFIHNLKRLAELDGLLVKFSAEQLDFIEELLPLNIQSRYPSQKEEIFKSLSSERCTSIINKTKLLSEWITQQL